MSELQKNLKEYKNTLLSRWEELPTMILTSSEKKNGKEEVLVLIDELIHDFNKDGMPATAINFSQIPKCLTCLSRLDFCRQLR